MVDVDTLVDIIEEKGKSVAWLAEAIGIDKSTLYRRLNSKGESFTVKEVNLIVELLGIDSERAMLIFFSNTVA